MMDFIDNHFATMATLIGTFGGVIVGGLINSFNQRNVENRKIEREKNLKTLHIYNKFLEANGRTAIAGNFDPPVFQHELYIKEIRGILYEDLSCLHDDVYELVRGIDYGLHQMKGSNYDDKTHEYVYELYLNVYTNIEKHFYKKNFDL